MISKLSTMYLPTVILLGMVLSFAGCSTSTSPPAEPEMNSDDYADVSEDFGVLLSNEDEGMLSLWMNEDDLFLPFDPQTAHSDTAKPPSGKRKRHHKGFDIEIEVTFYDADSNAYAEYDSATTVRATKKVSIEGKIVKPHRTATIHHEDFTEISGIAPSDTIRTVNGKGSRTVESTFKARWRDSVRTFKGEHIWSVDSFQFHKDKENYPYPLNGTITVETSVVLPGYGPINDINPKFSMGYTVEFDGSRYAEMTMTDVGTFWIDLDTGETYNERP